MEDCHDSVLYITNEPDVAKPFMVATADLFPHAMKRWDIPSDWHRNNGGAAKFFPRDWHCTDRHQYHVEDWDHSWLETYPGLTGIYTRDVVLSRRYSMLTSPRKFRVWIFFNNRTDLDAFLRDYSWFNEAPTTLRLTIPLYWEKDHDQRRAWEKQLSDMGAFNHTSRRSLMYDVEGKPQVVYWVYFASSEKAQKAFRLYQETELYAKHWHVKCQYKNPIWATKC